MSDFIISTCSTADLSKETFEERNINYACFHYEMDGISYIDDLFQSMTADEFYKRSAAGADVKTSQLNVDEFCEYFGKFLEEGKDLIHVSLSSGISGVSNSAMIAGNMLREKYPDRKIYVYDSLCASAGMGLLVLTMADMRDEGKSIDEIAKFVEDHKIDLQHWFFCTDLSAFIKGGRISKTAGLFAGALNICPLLHVDYEGKLIPMEKVRTKKKCYKRAVEKMIDYAVDGIDYSGNVCISNSYCPEDAEALAQLIRETLPKVGNINISTIGPTIGCHTGVGTTALFFWGKARSKDDK